MVGRVSIKTSMHRAAQLVVHWKPGIQLAILNAFLIIGFFGTMWISIVGNRLLFEARGLLLPVVPMVLFGFIFLTPVCWLYSSRWFPATDPKRWINCAIGTLPILFGVGLSLAVAMLSLILGAASPASVLIPGMASVVGVFAMIACFVVSLFAGGNGGA